MRRKLKRIVLVAIALPFISCTFNTTSLNQSEDKEMAEKIANDFYSYISEDNYEEACKLFSPHFLKVTPKDSLIKVFQRNKERLGEFKKNELQRWETREISGTGARVEYIVVYDIEYSKYKSIETIRLLKEGDKGDAKIFSYNIQSEGFLNGNKPYLPLS